MQINLKVSGIPSSKLLDLEENLKSYARSLYPKICFLEDAPKDLDFVELVDKFFEPADDSELLTASEVSKICGLKGAEAERIGKALTALGFSSKVARLERGNPKKVYLCKRKEVI